MNQITRNILLKFAGREVWMPVDLKGVFNIKYIALQLMMNGPTNLTEIEPADRDRTIRMAFTLNLKAWVIPDAVMLPTVRKIVTEMYIPAKPGVDYPSNSYPSDQPAFPDWLLNDWIFGNKTKTVDLTINPVDQNP